jgi:hypothetical protein
MIWLGLKGNQSHLVDTGLPLKCLLRESIIGSFVESGRQTICGISIWGKPKEFRRKTKKHEQCKNCVRIAGSKGGRS